MLQLHRNRLRSRLLSSTMIVGALALAAPALAQEAPAVQEPVVGAPEEVVEAAEAPSNEVEGVVVTGSRIVRQDYVANSPIVTVTGEATTENADVTLDTFLNTLPQISPGATTTSNNPPNNGIANIDLRGLGSNRNLVLIDGRRPMVSANTLDVDVNTIPQALIQSIEVITGGAGAAYGADAIAGAVNIRLRNNFEGVDIRASYSNSTEFWDAKEHQFSAVIGGNFADRRGNMVIAFDRSFREALLKSQRAFSQNATATTSYLPEGVYQFRGSNAPTEAAIDSVFAKYGVSADKVTRGSGTLGFNLDGTLFYRGVFNNPLDVQNFRYPIDGLVNQGLFPDLYSYNFDFVNLLGLPLDRYSLLTKGEYRWDNGIEVFTQFGWTEYTSRSNVAPTPVPTLDVRNPCDAGANSAASSPLVTCGSATGNNLVVPADNPFIPADFRALLNSRTGDDPGLLGAGAGEAFMMRQRTLDLGTRDSAFENTVVQFLGGVRGPIMNTGWDFEAYISEGRTEIAQFQSGNVDTNRLLELLDAPDGGDSICEGGFNPFGRQPISEECAEYLEVSATLTTDMKMNVAQAFARGDLWQMPAGPVQAAFGAEYRGFEYTFDPGALSGPISGFVNQDAEAGSNDFRDLFGELLVPLARDVPFIRSMDLSLGYRRSTSRFEDEINDIEGDEKTSHAYKVELDWQVVEPLRLRASLQQSVRAPNFNELFAGGNSAPQYFDPCSITSNARQGPNGAQIRALCGVAGGGVANLDAFVQTPGNQLSLNLSGNTNLDPEEGLTFTAGAVWSSPWRSRWLERLRGSVDYYRIEVSGAILGRSANQIVAACYNYYGTNPTYDPNNLNCRSLVRGGADIGRLTNPEDPSGAFLSTNGGSIETSGLDLQLDYGFDMEWLGLAPGWGQWRFNAIVTHLFEFVEQLPGGPPPIDLAGTVNYFGSGDGRFTTSHPEWRANLNARWELGDFDLAARVRYIAGMEHRLTREFPGETGFTAPDSVTYLDLNGGWKLTDNAELRLGVNNVFDKQPPSYAPNVQSGTDPSLYDVIGRRVFFGVNLRY